MGNKDAKGREKKKPKKKVVKPDAATMAALRKIDGRRVEFSRRSLRPSITLAVV